MGLSTVANKLNIGGDNKIPTDAVIQIIEFITLEPDIITGPFQGVRLAGRVIRGRSFILRIAYVFVVVEDSDPLLRKGDTQYKGENKNKYAFHRLCWVL
jgi:hypothetical protein